MKVANFNGVGGGTMIYTAHWPRMHPSDFKVQVARRGRRRLADRLLGARAVLRGERPHDGQLRPARRPGGAAAPSADAADPLGKTGARYAKAMNKLGWHWWPSDTSIATTDYEGRARCINLGHLHAGLRAGRQGKHGHHLLAARDPCWRRVAHGGRCRVREITTDENGMAAGAIYYDADGREQFQPAEVVILACNGVGTPRLLLNSASARFPDGLAEFLRPRRQEPDDASLAGHLLAMSTSGWMAAAARSPRCGASSSTRPIRHAASCGATRCSSTAALGPATQAIQGAAAGMLPWGRGHHRGYRELLDHQVGIGVACDDLPEEHNRVTLDPVLKDSNGIPAPKIDYTISENTHRMMEHGIAMAEEILRRRGRDPDPLLAHGAELSRPSPRHGPDGHRSGALCRERDGVGATT